MTSNRRIWHKSSYSDGEGGGECVEVAATPKPSTSVTPNAYPAPQLAVPATAWAEFIAYAAGSV
ncbi:hypothetical protein GCM10020000_25230 [Streptomyces olivoverticillatus]